MTFLGKLVKQLRTDEGKTLQDLADSVGLSGQSIWNLENTDKMIGIEHLPKLAKCLKVDSEILWDAFMEDQSASYEEKVKYWRKAFDRAS